MPDTLPRSGSSRTIKPNNPTLSIRKPKGTTCSEELGRQHGLHTSHMTIKDVQTSTKIQKGWSLRHRQATYYQKVNLLNNYNPRKECPIKHLKNTHIIIKIGRGRFKSGAYRSIFDRRTTTAGILTTTHHPRIGVT